MARQRDDVGPYWRVQSVVGWAHSKASAIAGHLLIAGINIDEVDDGVEWYCMCYVAVLDYFASNRAETAQKFDELHEWGTPSRPDVETWGDAQSTRAGALAMLDLVRGSGEQSRPRES